MNISIKTLSSIKAHLEKIKNDTFQENDIKILLIDIRENIRKESLLREFADFIAHPKRDKGIFNKILNVRYLKLKLINDQKEKLTDEVRKHLNTERQLSDFLLDSIDIQKIEKTIFEILFIDGLADLDEKIFREHYPINRKNVKKLISDNYHLDEAKKYFILKSQKELAKIEDVLKFIRGTIQAKPVFNQETFNKEIQTAIKRTIHELNLDRSFLEAVVRHSKPILLCILCLLHDAKFVFHDSHIGSCYISFYPSDKNLSGQPNKESFIALISADTSSSMPLFVSNIKVGHYIILADAELNRFQHMERMPYFNAIRNNVNQLILSE